MFSIGSHWSTLIVVLAVFFGGWATIFAGCLHADEAVSRKALKVGLLQVTLQCLVIGQIWAIFTALAIKKASTGPRYSEASTSSTLEV